VRVRLAIEGNAVCFAVADDGPGFDPSAVDGGTGLQGMADRLAALGGRLEVRSAAGQGTRVAGRIPIGLGVRSNGSTAAIPVT
jgi:signal transduction histidine kinase